MARPRRLSPAARAGSDIPARRTGGPAPRHDRADRRSRLSYSDPGYTAGFADINVAFSDPNCQRAALRPQLATAFAARLDPCERGRLGVPRVMAVRMGTGQVSVSVSGAPHGWAMRVFGARSRASLRTARSGKTLAAFGAMPGGYPYDVGRVTAGSSVKYIRAAWTKRGERPILGPIRRVDKLPRPGRP